MGIYKPYIKKSNGTIDELPLYATTAGEVVNLGYYDTITENSDGTYTITRQTGYLTINTEDITSGSNESPNSANAYLYAYYNRKVSDALYYWDAIIGISNKGFEVKCLDSGWVGVNKISINSTGRQICLGFETAKTQAEIQALCPIYVQYKLATATTEKVEKNYGAQYNQRFILEHNKSEAEKSANVFNKDLPTLIYGTGYEVPTTVNDWVKVYQVPVKGNTVYYSNKEMTVYASSDGVTYTGIGAGVTTFTTSSNTKYLCFCIYVGTNNATISSSIQTFSDLMLNEGTEPLPYQPYEGKVVHEKDLLSASVKTAGTADYFKYGRGVILADSTSFTNNFNKDIFGEETDKKFHLVELRTQGNAPSCLLGQHSSGIAWKGGDTYGSLMVRWGYPQIRVSGGNGNNTNPKWTVDLIHSNNISSETIKYATTGGGMGYYDKMTHNDDGTYTITRQTGYIVLDGVKNKFNAKFDNTRNGEYYYNELINYISRPSSPSIIGSIISNTLKTLSADDLYIKNTYGIAVDARGYILVGLTTAVSTLDDANAWLLQNPISIQYKLATATTEKVEEKHYARYNERFILEHNRTEAERSANLWDEITESGTLSGDDGSLENNSARLRSKNFIPISGNTRYIFNSSYVARINFYGSAFNFISTWVNNKTPFVTPSNAYFIKFDINSDYGTTYKNDIILNKGDIALPYQPYEGKVIHEKDLKNASTNLGYYDTVTESPDGTYTITKQTGYINGKDFLYWGMNGAGNRYVTFNHIKVNKNIENIIGNCSRVNWDSWWQSTFSQVTITYDGNNDFLIILLPYGTAENDSSPLNDIHIQYRLPNERTEIVEKNYCAQYNERFILEHNKTEAERSANLWDLGQTFNCPNTSNITYDDLQLQTFNDDTYVSVLGEFTWNSNSYVTFTKTSNYNKIKIVRNGDKSYITIKEIYCATLGLTNDNTYTLSLFNNRANMNDSFTISNIMLNEGPVALTYQPYVGRIIHKKDLDNLPKLYNHFLTITLTKLGISYLCRVNILSTSGSTIADLTNFGNVCSNARNIFKTQVSGTRYYFSMPAEGVQSTYETSSDTLPTFVIFRLFASIDLSGSKILYIYYVNRSNNSSSYNFAIVDSTSAVSISFSDTVTPVYGGE